MNGLYIELAHFFLTLNYTYIATSIKFYEGLRYES
ncbi:Uncharacterised protein [Legionella maceachernii]|nr:Uncharacterised protein [Legionella maceachernii]